MFPSSDPKVGCHVGWFFNIAFQQWRIILNIPLIVCKFPPSFSPISWNLESLCRCAPRCQLGSYDLETPLPFSLYYLRFENFIRTVLRGRWLDPSPLLPSYRRLEILGAAWVPAGDTRPMWPSSCSLTDPTISICTIVRTAMLHSKAFRTVRLLGRLE